MATPDDTIEQSSGNVGTSESLNDAAEARAAAGGTEQEAVDEEEAAMLAGYQSARSDDSDDTDTTTTTTSTATTEGTTTGADGDGGKGGEGGADAGGAGEQASGEVEQEIPGLGKPSEIRAQLATAAKLQEQLAGVNGRVGHLQQLVTQAQQAAGKGKTITKESLKRVSNEFGAEFAESLAADLNEAGGLGGPAGLDEEAINQRVAQAVSTIEQRTERKLVTRDHKDAADYFAGGKQHDAFVAFVNALPPERKQLVMSSWDSDVISPAIAEFKAHRDKAVTDQARQQSRVARAVAPTQGRNASATQPTVDPMEFGFNSVAKSRTKPSQARRA